MPFCSCACIFLQTDNSVHVSELSNSRYTVTSHPFCDVITHLYLCARVSTTPFLKVVRVFSHRLIAVCAFQPCLTLNTQWHNILLWLSISNRNVNGNSFCLLQVFLKEVFESYLEYHRKRILHKAVLVIQKWTRGFLARKNYLRERMAVIMLQSRMRAWLAKSRYQKIRRGVVRLQAVYKGNKDRQKFKKVLFVIFYCNL